jgi:hypothetical protein
VRINGVRMGDSRKNRQESSLESSCQKSPGELACLESLDGTAATRAESPARRGRRVYVGGTGRYVVTTCILPSDFACSGRYKVVTTRYIFEFFWIKGAGAKSPRRPLVD